MEEEAAAAKKKNHAKLERQKADGKAKELANAEADKKAELQRQAIAATA